jgi:hypothetical protein
MDNASNGIGANDLNAIKKKHLTEIEESSLNDTQKQAYKKNIENANTQKKLGEITNKYYNQILKQRYTLMYQDLINSLRIKPNPLPYVTKFLKAVNNGEEVGKAHYTYVTNKNAYEEEQKAKKAKEPKETNIPRMLENIKLKYLSELESLKDRPNYVTNAIKELKNAKSIRNIHIALNKYESLRPTRIDGTYSERQNNKKKEILEFLKTEKNPSADEAITLIKKNYRDAQAIRRMYLIHIKEANEARKANEASTNIFLYVVPLIVLGIIGIILFFTSPSESGFHNMNETEINPVIVTAIVILLIILFVLIWSK